MNKLKNIALGVGIIILFGLALWQGIEAFYPSPQYDDFCNIELPRQIIETQTQCEDTGGKWTPQDVQCITTPCPQGYCDYYYECNKQYEGTRDSHSKIVFIISLIVGIITIIIGYSLLSTEPVGSALIGSGIWAIFWGTAVNWRNFANIGRFIFLLLTLVLLIWLTLRLNKPTKLLRKNN